MSCSPTPTVSPDSTQPLSCQMVSKGETAKPLEKVQEVLPRAQPNLKFVTNSTWECVSQLTPTASTDMSAKAVKSQAMERKIAREGASEIYGLQPKYLRHNLWEESSTLSPTTAEWSEWASPLPRPPLSEMSNPVVRKTIEDNPDLFQIITPIKVDVFEKLLVNHPNQPFVRSVCAGLREGFWPWADTLREGLPATYDESRPMPSNPNQADFIRKQCVLEQQKGRFSRFFGQDLLPGMYSMPVHGVPKPNTDEFRLVTDHSAGAFSLNSMIDHTKVTGYPLDNLRHLGEILLDIKRSIGNVPLTMWKSDISEAYRLLPMSPYWQIKQVNTIDGARCIDRNLAFGSSAAAAIFISFDSLVAWIAKYVELFEYLANYMDDSSGCDLEGDTLYYEPYACDMPSHQKRLLVLWDELGIPHKPHKQLSGSPLTIIGIEVDPNKMTLTLPASSRTCLLDELTFWTSKPPKNSSGSFKLKHWERMTGWFNWALNVYPHLRPALNNVYAKIGGKRNREQRVYINNAIRDDLSWATHHIKNSDGVHILKSITWDPTLADFTIFCDACPEGMGFWYPVSKEGYYAPTPINVPSNVIFYFESLCVLSALTHVEGRAPQGSKIVIYTDNLNTVDIFHSYRCLPQYNHLLKSAVDITTKHDFNLRVLHVPGVDNVVADALSRVKFSIALEHEPHLRFFNFHPPGTVGLPL